MPAGPFTNDVLTKLAEFNTINSPLYNSTATYTFEPNTTGSVSPEVTALLTSFDVENTGTFYPELTKIKLLTIDANRFSPNTVIYNYTFTLGIDYFKSILSNLQYLFPDMFIYYNKGSFVQSLTYDSIKFIPSDIYTNSAAINNTIFISQTALQIIGQLIFSYDGTVAPTSPGQIPFIEASPYVTFTYGTVINLSTVTVTVNVLVDYAYNSSNYGLSFANTSGFNYNLPNLSITTLTNISLSNAGSQFAGLTTLSITTGQNPIIRSVSSLASCFSGCTNFNSNISGWNTTTKNVTNMYSCFLNCTNFNNGNGQGDKNVLGWTLSKDITTLESCFSGCTNFNSKPHGTTAWLIANTTNVVTTIAKCFYNCTYFNNGFDPGISSINVLWSGAYSITDMTSCFEGCQSFNSSVASWQVNGLKKLDSCFKGCQKFNSFFNLWNYAPLTSMTSCFEGCTNFNNNGSIQNLNFNTTDVTSLNSCFKGCSSFNSVIGAWNTTNVADISFIFQDATAFNNGDVLNGTNKLMSGWSFNAPPTSTNWHLNSALTYENASTALKVLYPPPP
jgi:surface protein